jgi:NitT/TauT family transport system ATP-binding protein
MQPFIEIDGVSKRFHLSRSDYVDALVDISFEIYRNEFVALVGPSGCGKSTLLRMIAGLDEPSDGVIKVGDDHPRELIAQQRVGMAMQEHGLMPWLDAVGNVSLPFRLAGLPIDPERVEELLELVKLSKFSNARPSQLSGGMKQRLSIARALVLQPDLLILDEPFGALDAVTRRMMNQELQRIWSRKPTTTVLVTHSLEEAVFLSDRILMMSPNPGTVISEYPVPLPRPRTLETSREKDFLSLVESVTARLDEICATELLS